MNRNNIRRVSRGYHYFFVKPGRNGNLHKAVARLMGIRNLVAFRIGGLESGIYHFNFDKFSLELLLKANLKKHEHEIVSPFVDNPAGAIILTSVISRSEVKYGWKSYPYSLIEAGHIGQNIALTCEKFGIGSCPVGGFVNDTVSELLDLTEDEIPLYVIGFGSI